MTRTAVASPALGGFLDPVRAPSARADGATVGALFVVALLVIPARAVLRGLPLSMTPAELLGLGMGLWWLVAQLTTTLGAAKGRTPVRSAVFGYATAVLVTYGAATHGHLPVDELSQADHALVLAMAYFGVTVLICDGVRTRQRLDLVLKTVVVTGAVVAVVGAFQFVLAVDLTQYLVLPGLRFGAEYDFVLERESFRRVAATLGHPIEFGVVSSMILPLAVHYGSQARKLGLPAGRWWCCTAMIAAGLMFSVSRSAMLGVLGAGFVLFLGWSGTMRARALAAVAVFLVAVKVMIPGLLGTFFGLFANFGSDDSVRWRTHDYSAAATEIGRNPLFGRGLGTWYAPKHQVFDNQYLHTLVETGVVGLAMFVLTFGCAIYSGVKARGLARDSRTRDLGLTLAACLVVPLIGSATFDLMSFHAAVGLSFLLAGAAGALLRITRDTEAAPGTQGAASR